MSIEDKINTRDFTSASALLATLSTSGFIEPELTYYDFLQLYNKYMATPVLFDASDKSLLVALANKCTETGGQAVYQSRALYQLVTGFVFNAPADCNNGQGARRSNLFSEKSMPLSANKIIIYPNPTDRLINIVGHQPNSTGNYTILDSSGRLVASGTINGSSSEVRLQIQLLPGIYTFCLSYESTNTYYAKLVITQ